MGTDYISRAGNTRHSAVATRQPSLRAVNARCLVFWLALLLLHCETILADITSIGDVEFVQSGQYTNLLIGQAADGQMMIDHGSDLTVNATRVGKGIENVATLDVVGVGSALRSPDSLAVSGFGRLRIADGGFVSSGDLVNSSLEYGISSIELSGMLSSILVARHITLGQSNPASLYVHDGATVDAGTAWGYLGPLLSIRLDDGNIALRNIDFSGHLRGSGTVSTNLGSFRNSGTIQAGTSLTIAGSSFLNLGTIDVGSGTLIYRTTYGGMSNLSGTITLNGGQLVLNTFSTTPLENLGDLIAYSGVSHIYGGVMNSGSVSLNRNSELHIHGDLFNFQTGAVDLQASGFSSQGKLQVHGDLTNTTSGLVDLAAGLGIVNGNFTSTNATLITELIETDTGRQYGKLQVGGEATLNGTNTMQLKAPSRYMFQLGDGFDFLTAAEGITGSLSLGDMPELDDSLRWKLSSDSHTLRLSVGLPGDFNGDLAVNLADYVVWRNTLGSFGSFLAADESGPGGLADGVVDQWDYELWKENFGRSGADLEVSSTVAIPEPGSWMLVAGGMLLAAVWRTAAR